MSYRLLSRFVVMTPVKYSKSRSGNLERGMHLTGAMARLSSILLCALVAFAACENPETADDTLAAEQVSGAVVNAAELARVVQPLDGSEALAAFDSAAVLAEKIRDAIDKYESAVVRPECITSDTDFATFVELTFDECNTPLNLVAFDGSLRADLALELDGLGEPLVIRFGLSTDRLEITTLRRNVVYTDTDFETRFAVDGASPVEFLGDVTVTELGQTLDISAEASWSVDGNCVTLDGGAQVGGSATGELGTISASVQNLNRCADACPETGDVAVSYGEGTFLRWSYDGSDVVSVSGPRGKQLDVPLACGD